MTEDAEPHASDVTAGSPVPDTVEIVVVNDSSRLIRISSHYPFWRADWFLRFDRDRAAGYRLNVPEGTVMTFEPHTSYIVQLIRVREAQTPPTEMG
jgi:urease beta subunit